jgi:hypothetical protein
VLWRFLKRQLLLFAAAAGFCLLWFGGITHVNYGYSLLLVGVAFLILEIGGRFGARISRRDPRYIYAHLIGETSLSETMREGFREGRATFREGIEIALTAAVPLIIGILWTS